MPDVSPRQSELIATKMFIPRAQRTLIARLRLVHLLDAYHNYALTLVAAPAGFGKTTLVATWLAERMHAAGRRIGEEAQAVPAASRLQRAACAWVSLDSSDNDPAQFWAYVFAALHAHEPDRFVPHLALLRAAQPPPIEQLLTALINTLHEQPTQFVLVLDDYHLIEEDAIHRALTFLIAHMPPCLHLVLLTRADPPLPLARLRANNELLEIRAHDLRCTETEAADFLGTSMRLQLPANAVANVAARTEGWLVGLQLFGLWLQGRADPQTALGELHGMQKDVFDYLAEQVWEQLPEQVRLFLLRTSILERLTASLCDAVAGQPRSQIRLEQLERANLFIVPLDADRRWYRYHHLFSATLRTQLERECGDEVATLHQRASRWHAEHGFTHAAIEHAICARDWQQAAMLVEGVCAQLDWGERESQLRKLRRWFAALPETIIRSHPCLSYQYAYVTYGSSAPTTLESWLGTAEALLADVEDQPYDAARANLLGELLTFRAFLTSTTGAVETTLVLSNRALGLLGPWNNAARADAVFTQSVAYYSAGDVVLAAQKALQSAHLAQSAGCIATAVTHMSVAAKYTALQGRLHAAARILAQAQALAQIQHGVVLPMACWAWLYLADIQREWSQLETATAAMRESVRLSEQTESALFGSNRRTIEARIAATRGDLIAAEAIHRTATQLPAELQRLHTVYSLVDQVRLWIAQGQLQHAVHWLAGIETQRDRLAPLARERLAVAGVYVLLAQQRSAETLVRVPPLLARARQQHRWDHVIELLVLRALAHEQHGETTAALHSLASALRLARPQGYMRQFLDAGAPLQALLKQLNIGQRLADPYIQALLAAFDAAGVALAPAVARAPIVQTSSQPASLVEPLSERECDVLCLLARGASNLAIAQKLGIAANTVKHHVSNVIGKLGVANRTQAMERARTLGLIAYARVE
jgi:LuxR family transcriptional regulator, maltose regulon positive regulatory protein